MVRQVIETRFTPQLNNQVQKFFRASVNMNDIRTVRRLLKYQRDFLDVNAKDYDGTTPLHWCALHGYKRMMSLLLKEGADIRVIDNNGLTCLHVGVQANDFQLCEYLLKKGVDPMKRTFRDELAVDLSNQSSITYLLVQHMQQKDIV